MSRPKSAPFTLGAVTVKPHPTTTRHYQARGYFNDADSNRREVTASGTSAAAAKRALATKVQDARDEWRGGDELLRHDTLLSRAADVWLDWKRRQRTGGKPLAESTLALYSGIVRRTIQAGILANLPLVKVNDVGRIESWLSIVADTEGEVSAKQARKVLGGTLELAERRGAIPASVMHRVRTPAASAGSTGDRKCTDAECDYDCGKRHLDTKRAFTADEAVRVLAAVENTNADVADLAHFLFGTGVRIAEALHCVSWADVDLDIQTVHVRGTKTAQADRILSLSDDLTERLRDRAATYGTTGLVLGVTRYPSKLGEPRDRNNVCKTLRRVFTSVGVQWAGTHTFRRTVASWMDAEGCPLAEIANQLGHANTNVTAGYLGRRTAPTRAASVMVLPEAPRPALRAV